MRKPVIGIVPLMDMGKDSYWMLPGYMKGIEEAGGIPLMMPLNSDPAVLSQLVSEMDGFLFTGGQDVGPELYGEVPSPQCGEVCRERDEMERALLSVACGQDKAILGICRGIQFINAAMGGKLYQDLPTEYPSETEHHQSPPYDRPIHSVRLVSGSPLYQLLKTETLPVNSYHHQAVKELAPGLKAMAYSEDGLVEAIYMPTKKFVWALQWHPEFSFKSDANSRKIFEAFIYHSRC